MTHVEKPNVNREAFSHLIIRENKKKLILSLVSEHGSEDDDSDDHITGKGKGLVFLLHGPPGVGRTLTAGEY